MQREALVPGVTEEEMIRLMETYSGILLGICSLILGDRDMAQDVVQETFLKAWKRQDYQRESEKAWLLRVAVNLCHDYHRSRWWRHIDHRLTPEDLSLAASEEPDGDVIHLVKQLPMKEREVVILFFWNNMSAEEIGEALGITRSAVYRRLDTAKKHLKLEMEGG